MHLRRIFEGNTRLITRSRRCGAGSRSNFRTQLTGPHISPPFYCARRSARRVGAYSLQPTRRSVGYAFAVFRSVPPSRRHLDALATNGGEICGPGLPVTDRAAGSGACLEATGSARCRQAAALFRRSRRAATCCYPWLAMHENGLRPWIAPVCHRADGVDGVNHVPRGRGPRRGGPSPHISPPFYCGRRSARRVGAYSRQPARRSVSYAFAAFRSVPPVTAASRRPRDERR